MPPEPFSKHHQQCRDGHAHQGAGCRNPQVTLWAPTWHLTAGRLRGSAHRVCDTHTANTRPTPDCPACAHTFYNEVLYSSSCKFPETRETRNPSNPRTFCQRGPAAHTDTNTDQVVSRAPTAAANRPLAQLSSSWPSCPLAAPAWPAHPHRAPNKRRGSGGGRGGGGGGEGALYPIPTATGTFPPLGSLSTLSQQTPPPRLWPGVQLAGAGKPSQTARGQQRSGRASLLPGIPPATGVRSRYSRAPPLPSTPLLLDPAPSLSHPPVRPAPPSFKTPHPGPTPSSCPLFP